MKGGFFKATGLRMGLIRMAERGLFITVDGAVHASKRVALSWKQNVPNIENGYLKSPLILKAPLALVNTSTSVSSVAGSLREAARPL